MLYAAGMFLNDAVDQEFDRRYRPERPIVSGRIASRTVWVCSFVLLFAGWAAFIPFGKVAMFFAATLVFLIAAYDIVHKSTVLAPLLMASCRFTLYLVVACAATGIIHSAVLWRAAALGGYIVGLSYLARGESTGGRFANWTGVLLFVPAIVALFMSSGTSSTCWTALIVQVTWILWCCWPNKSKLRICIPTGVAGLLAGIALVDWLAAGACGWVFVGLFLFALLLQRIAPAT